MEICAIHGSNRKGNTDKTITIIKEQLNSYEKITYSDVYLPRDLPRFCDGCFTCICTGDHAGQNCPHKQYTRPIWDKILKSDGIIIASPSYALAESAQIKALLDHYACSFITHRPSVEMFDKIGLVVSTAAGAGTGRVISTISRNLLFWGVKRIVKCGVNIWEIDWENIQEKRRSNAERLLRKKTLRFYRLTKKRYKLRTSLVTKTLMFFFRWLIASYPDTHLDKIYWEAKGWL